MRAQSFEVTNCASKQWGNEQENSYENFGDF